MAPLASEQDVLAAADALAAALRAGAAERDRAPAGTVPWEALGLLDASGLLSITLPQDVGGLDAGPVLLAEVVARLAAADPAIAQVPQAHFLLLDVLTVWGGDAARDRLRAEVAGGGVRIGNALAERGGLHAQDLKTRLTRDGEGRRRLDGAKHYCTGALSARWIGVSALDDDGGLMLAFVERAAEGVAVETDWDVIGQRATVSGTVTFDGVVVEDELVLNFARAFEVPQQLGARAQLVHAAIEAGIARGALDDARAYLTEKARPSSEAVRAGATRAVDDPHVLHRYGRAAVDVRAAEALLRDAARELEDIGLVPAGADAAARP